MTDILAEICEKKREHIIEQKIMVPESRLREQISGGMPVKNFYKALANKVAAKQIALIAEIKKASPSRGVIRPDFNPASIAGHYQEAGVTCISVLTDVPFFQGCDDDLRRVRATVSLPLLRKDFMLDPYQILESRALGADCILLIMAALSDHQALELEQAAQELSMSVLVEVHNREELERALILRSPLIGINNRNLKTLEVSLDVTEILCGLIPEDKLLVCESGIYTHADILRMKQSGVYSFLVGESMMKQDDIGYAVRKLMDGG